MLLFLRFLPFIVAVLDALLFRWQAMSADTYPWLAVAGVMMFCCAGFMVGRRRIEFRELVSKLFIPLIALIVLAYGLLLAEGLIATFAIPITAAVIVFAALELTFLLAYLPSRYPVNGLSRLGLSLVPVILWIAQSTSVGLLVFIRISHLIPLVVMALITAFLFWFTSYRGVSEEHRKRWTMLGAWLGLQLGLLAIFLPVNLSVQGALAAISGCLALRCRRYGIAPRKSARVVWIEVACAIILLVLVLGTARWV
jgi:hypothetical protein